MEGDGELEVTERESGEGKDEGKRRKYTGSVEEVKKRTKT